MFNSTERWHLTGHHLSPLIFQSFLISNAAYQVRHLYEYLLVYKPLSFLLLFNKVITPITPTSNEMGADVLQRLPPVTPRYFLPVARRKEVPLQHLLSHLRLTKAINRRCHKNLYGGSRFDTPTFYQSTIEMGWKSNTPMIPVLYIVERVGTCISFVI